jgi:hypothetical protein
MASVSTLTKNFDDNAKLAMPNAEKCKVKKFGQEHDAQPKTPISMPLEKVNAVMPSMTPSR